MSNDSERDNLQAMFDEIRKSTKWNLDGELLWSYFFTDPSSEKLLAAAPALGKLGFTVVGVSEAEFEDDHVHGEDCDHDHEGHDHAGHDHAGHDHAAHPHAGHDHAGHDHAAADSASAHVHDENCAHADAKADGEELFFVLQVDEVRPHTVDSLHERHLEMRAFATERNLEAFDGIEVGEVTATPIANTPTKH